MLRSTQALLLTGLLSVSWHFAHADGLVPPCGTTLTSTNSSFTFPQSLTDPCTITVTNNTVAMGVEINAKTLGAAGARLVVYDGNAEAANPAVVDISQSQEGLAAVFTSSNITFVLTKGDTTSSISVNLYEGCRYTKNVSSLQYLEWHPLYKKDTEFICTYRYNVETNTRLALSFIKFQLPDTNLTIVGDNTTTVGKNASMPGDVYGPSLTLTLGVNKSKTEQLFSAILTPVYSDADCNKEHDVSGTKEFHLEIPFSTNLYDCRILLKAAPGKSLRINITELILASIQDSVTIVDGPSIVSSPHLDKLTQDTTGYLILSSGNTVTVRFVADSVPGQRSFNFSATELNSLNRFDGDKNFRISDSGAQVSYYVLKASSPTSRLRFWLEENNDTKPFEVKVLDGAQPSSPLLAIFSSKIRYPVLSSGQYLFLEATNATNFTVDVTMLPLEGCDKMSTKDVGSFALKLAKGPGHCNWTIEPLQKGLIELTFSTLTLIQDTQLEVYSVSENARTGARLLSFSNSAPQLPPPIIVSDVVQLVFNATGSVDLSSVSVTASYQLVSSGCGGELAGSSGVLYTPGFPNQYALNSRCTWTLPAGAGTVRLFNFEQFHLGPGHKLVFSQSNGSNTTVIKEYEGSPSITKDLIYTTNLTNTLSFDANLQNQSIIVGGGFKINYWIMTCGGSLHASEGNFNTVVKKTFCIWVISLPASKNVVNFTLTINETKPSPEMVKIYEGGSLSNPLMQQFNFSRSILSRNDSIVVVFNNTGAGGNINLTLAFSTYECNKFCANGYCMHPDWICNGKNDCWDNTDELNCTAGPTPAPMPTPAPAPSRGDEVRGYVVAILFFVGLVIGVVLVFVVRKVRQTMRGNRYQSFGGEES